jgi:hypothetical protein
MTSSRCIRSQKLSPRRCGRVSSLDTRITLKSRSSAFPRGEVDHEEVRQKGGRPMEIGGYGVGQEFAVGWGTLAMINAGLAQSKNRGGLSWFLLSLLLGPVATFVLVTFMGRLPDAGGAVQSDAAQGDH